MPDHLITPVSNAGGRRALAVASGAALLLLALALAGDRMTSARAGIALDLPRLMLWAWDRDDDLRFIDTADTGVAYLAATLTLRGEDVVLTPRHNPLTLPPDVRRAAVVHVETDRGAPPLQSGTQLGRFVEAIAAVGEAAPHRVLQVDYEAPASQRGFLIDTLAALRSRLPGAAVSVTGLASWCFNESWTGRLDADEIVPMLFRMGYDGRRLRTHLAGGGDFRGAQCRSSLGVATDELPGALPPGKRVYAFSPRRWTFETYQMVRARISQWSHDQPSD